MEKGYTYNLGQAFENIAANHADRIVFRYPDGQVITYAFLNQRSNQFIHFLNAKNVKQGNVIVLFNNKSPDAFALMIACLKMGVIYTNIDVTSPFVRVMKIIDQCKPAFIFNDFGEMKLVEEISALNRYDIVHGDPLFLDTINNNTGNPVTNLQQVHGNMPAYIMFTSGSTGFPKGALISHANILNFIQWSRSTFEITPEDILTNVNPVYFDNSVFDFYSAVFTGASMVPLNSKQVNVPAKLISYIDDLACTIWFSVPSMLVYLLTTKALGKYNFKTVRTIIFGGEGFPKPKLKNLFDLYHDRIKLVNVYGPTECTCICSSYDIGIGDFEVMNELAPIGNLAPNFGFEIDQTDPQTGIGELLLSGPNVGLGYYDDFELTSKAFVQNPNQPKFRDIVYRTGDLVKDNGNGFLYFKGRKDFQIKHMGYRIELEEIESVLNTLAYVNESAVLYKKMSNGLGQIMAFVSCNGNQAEEEVKRDLKNLVPPYMYPKKIQVLKTLPKNRNGKIDRITLKEKYL
jgi:amino acid adenylation domain-containing protein